MLQPGLSSADKSGSAFEFSQATYVVAERGGFVRDYREADW